MKKNNNTLLLASGGGGQNIANYILEAPLKWNEKKRNIFELVHLVFVCLGWLLEGTVYTVSETLFLRKSFIEIRFTYRKIQRMLLKLWDPKSSQGSCLTFGCVNLVSSLFFLTSPPHPMRAPSPFKETLYREKPVVLKMNPDSEFVWWFCHDVFY